MLELDTRLVDEEVVGTVGHFEASRIARIEDTVSCSAYPINITKTKRMINLRRGECDHLEERLGSRLAPMEDETADDSGVEWECCAIELMG